MRWVVYYRCCVDGLGVAASGLILAQEGSTLTATAVRLSTPLRRRRSYLLSSPGPVSQIAQATGSKRRPLFAGPAPNTSGFEISTRPEPQALVAGMANI